MKSVIFFLILVTTGKVLAQQDTLYLQNGDTIIGSIFTQNKYITKIYVDSAWMFIQNTELIRDFDPVIYQESEKEIVVQPSPEYFTIPTGEFLIIQTNRRLNSRFTKTGEIVECRLAQGILDNEGRVILPRNTPVIGRVKFARNGTAFTRANLQLELIEIHINGEAIPIQSTDNIRILNNYTAQRVLGSAASGSVIGGVFYNEWLRGALIGAAVGTVSSLIVENRNIIIPEGSTLEFMLDSQVRIRIR